MLGTLAERLGVSALPRGVAASTATDRDLVEPVLARSVLGAAALHEHPSGVVASGPVVGWVREQVLPVGGWRLGPEPLLEQLRAALAEAVTPSRPPLTLVPHRQLRTMNSQLRDIAAPGGRTEEVAVLAHPTVCRSLGPDGTPVSVRSPWGQLEGRLRADERLHPEAVAIAHGWGSCNVSALTSAREAVDPLTGMVLQSGVPVELTVRGAPPPPR
jgi:anaerobic selenocysteine-containing dehydrogenase